MTCLRTALAALATTAALVAPTAPAHAADAIDLSRPGSLQRGDDIRIPHLEGTTIVDGDPRIEVRRAMTLMGTSGDDYIVSVRNQRSRYRVKRVTPEGDTTVLLRGRDALYTQLSGDGTHMLHNDNQRRTRITAYGATDGNEVASARFRGYAEVLDADDGTVLMSSWQRGLPGTSPPAPANGSPTESPTRPTFRRTGSLSTPATRIGTGAARCRPCPTPTPCTVLWRSCRQKVVAFSPDGALVASVHILADGVGPGEVQLRETDGSLLTRYRANWFGAVQWEDDDTLLLEANGRRKGATVRCDGADCERASDVVASSP